MFYLRYRGHKHALEYFGKEKKEEPELESLGGLTIFKLLATWHRLQDQPDRIHFVTLHSH